MAVSGKRKSFEVNPWFRYYVERDGRNSALREAISVGRDLMTEPQPGRCGHDLWYRPLVDTYTCPTCEPGKYRFDT